MHIITLHEPITRGPYSLPAGSYLVDNINAGEFLTRHPTTIEVQAVSNPKPIATFTPRPDGAPPRFLFIRPGGFGDLLFLAPVIRRLKLIHPSAHIAVACFDHFASIFTHNPDVAEIAPYPIPFSLIDSFDAIIPLENTLETETHLHAVDRFLLETCILPNSVDEAEKRCIYHLTPTERDGALSAFPTKLDATGQTIPRLGVQVVASAMCRSYSHDLLEQVCEMLHRRGWEIFFFGPPMALKIEERDRIVNLSLRGLNFRQSAAVLSTCDVVLAPDSALAHIAGALDLPCVALYGPFPWKLRTAYHPKTIALQGNEHTCAPCFHHPNAGRSHFPEHGPCARTGRCEVLASIKPGRIAAKIDALYKASVHISEHRAAGKIS